MKWFIGVAVLALVVGVAVAFSGSPPRLLRWIARAFPDAVFYRDTNEKIVALTIDDVPSPNEASDGATQLILDAIAEHNQGIADPALKVRATFFVITGGLADGGTILEKIREEGHEIGNHGTVDATVAMLSPVEFEQELRASDERLASFTDQTIRWLRPGRGFFNRAMVARLRATEGYEPKVALASMLPIDNFWPTNAAGFTAWYATRHIFPGAILLVHGGTREQSRRSAEALKTILGELSQRGYRVVTLSELWDLN